MPLVVANALDVVSNASYLAVIEIVFLCLNDNICGQTQLGGPNVYAESYTIRLCICIIDWIVIVHIN